MFEVKKIYIDMDGVLADFDKGVSDICGMIPKTDQTVHDEEWDNKLWAGVKAAGHFYDMLDPLPGAVEMFKTIYEAFGDKFEILTGIPKEKRGIDTAAEDKIKWTRRLLSETVVINTVYRAEKQQFCLGPEYVLIDDHPTNIKEWVEMGGTGVFHVDAKSTIEKLKELNILN